MYSKLCTTLDSPRSFKAPRFQDSRQTKVPKLSALQTKHLNPSTTLPGNITGTHFCQKLNRPRSHGAAGRIMSITNSNDTTVNRTRDLPAQYLTQLRHRALLIMSYINEYSIDMHLKTIKKEIRWVHIVMTCTAHLNAGTCFVQLAL